jgi:hypothetical protein
MDNGRILRVFTWKAHFSVTSGGEYILPKIFSALPWMYLNAFGKQLAVTSN